MLAAGTEQTSDGVITFNPSGAIEYLNPGAIKLCGMPAVGFGTTFTILFPLLAPSGE